jgi:hypothetical protein
MSGIFVSYRREDGASHVGRLHDRLITRFGRKQVFKNIDFIKPGEDLTQAIKEAIAFCDVLIAVIGKRWLTETDGKGIRPLDNPRILFGRRSRPPWLARRESSLRCSLQAAD